MSASCPLSFDAALVERAVLAAVSARSAAVGEGFHRERELLYDEPDEEAREAGFGRLHRRWFGELGLGRPFAQALDERPAVAAGTCGAHLFGAITRREEHADLLVPPGAHAAPTLVMRLRPERFVEPGGLLRFLRRELLHVADMLDPAFAYAPELPPGAPGPALDNLLRERYRVLWETTVEGRLLREGRAPGQVRDAARRRFLERFSMLGAGAEAAFGRWFDGPRPTHPQLVAFARDPRAGGEGRARGWEGWCPACRMPSAVDAAPGLSPEQVRRIRAARPSWRPSQGLCAQCSLLLDRPPVPAPAAVAAAGD